VSGEDKDLKAGNSYVLTAPEFKIREIEGQSRPMTVGFRIMGDDEGIYDTTNRAFETDEADKYRSHHMVDFEKSRTAVFTSIPVLNFLWGEAVGQPCAELRGGAEARKHPGRSPQRGGHLRQQERQGLCVSGRRWPYDP
jgi:hypothetical protein